MIVEKTGVTKPTLYHYFGSKLGLFETLVAERGEHLIHLIREASLYAGDVTQSIQNVVQAYFDFAKNHPTFYRLLISTWFSPPSSEYFTSVQHLLHQQHLLLEDMFRHAANNHGNMKGRHQQYAISLKGMIDTYIGMAINGYVDLQKDDMKYRLIHQFMHGIFS